jgi:hypothetical protein
MARKRTTTDRRPGRLPDIRAIGDSVIFAIRLAEDESGANLVLRCDAEGNVWASIPVAGAAE